MSDFRWGLSLLDYWNLKEWRETRSLRRFCGPPLPRSICAKVFQFAKVNLLCFFVLVRTYLLQIWSEKSFFFFRDSLYFLKNCFDTIATILAQTIFTFQAISKVFFFFFSKVFYVNTTNCWRKWIWRSVNFSCPLLVFCNGGEKLKYVPA